MFISEQNGADDLQCLIFGALWVRRAPSHLSRSEYRHGSISIDGVYPYMPDEEVEKDLGPRVQELALSGNAGHTHLYARGGRRTVVEFDSQSWTALQISGHQLEKNGLVVLQIGDTQAKAQQVMNCLSPEKVEIEGDTLSVPIWDGLRVDCHQGRVRQIEMHGH